MRARQEGRTERKKGWKELEARGETDAGADAWAAPTVAGEKYPSRGSGRDG